ncbi:MAG TPA: glycosyltransferase family 2 protein [Polyangiaceae bacterium]|jgi:cellulose synthase/poly-beta-1,6-N-acetylglucosamine synthase-like glycosyltransferase|nr:glycosyltransferase family 2 protein [Polyangiaceae bacterium]
MTALALLCIAVVLYTYVGYPVMVAAWARIAPRRFRPSDSFEPTVSICMAVYNGERFLAAKLRSLQALDYPKDKIEILVCSDGSTDDTERIVREFTWQDPRIGFLSTGARVGKPSALNLLSRVARGDVLLMCDVRQPLSTDALRGILPPLADTDIGCVSGNLVLSGDTGAGAYWTYEKLIRGSEALLGSLVGVSGSLYAVRRREMPELPSDVLLDDMFVPLSIARAGRKSVVFSERARIFDEACDDDREFQRKVRTLAGNFQLVAMMPWLLVPRTNPMWVQLMSHKLLRLACPWALVALLLASMTLSFRTDLPTAELLLWRTLTVSQLALYGMAAAGARLGRLGALARTFTVLNAAAVAGFFRFVRNSQPVTW